MNCLKLIRSIATSVSSKALTQILQSVGRVAISTVVALVVFVSPATAETYFYHNDHLGTPQALTDGDQSIVWQAEYDPFGKATETVATVEQNLRFPRQYLDRETGLHYNYFRTYDPEIGRYVKSDPIGLRGGINTYGYVGQNPINRFDPYGLYECSCLNTSSGGGNGAAINGRKQFNYACTCFCADGSSQNIAIQGGSQGSDYEGQTALGALLSTGVSRAGEVFTYATGFEKFNVDTSPPWYQFWDTGEDTLNSNIDSKMDALCEDCESK